MKCDACGVNHVGQGSSFLTVKEAWQMFVGHAPDKPRLGEQWYEFVNRVGPEMRGTQNLDAWELEFYEEGRNERS
jgi:hypothetical protein